MCKSRTARSSPSRPHRRGCACAERRRRVPAPGVRHLALPRERREGASDRHARTRPRAATCLASSRRTLARKGHGAEHRDTDRPRRSGAAPSWAAARDALVDAPEIHSLVDCSAAGALEVSTSVFPIDPLELGAFLLTSAARRRRRRSSGSGSKSPVVARVGARARTRSPCPRAGLRQPAVRHPRVRRLQLGLEHPGDADMLDRYCHLRLDDEDPTCVAVNSVLVASRQIQFRRSLTSERRAQIRSVADVSTSSGNARKPGRSCPSPSRRGGREP